MLGDSLWLAGEPDARSARGEWPRAVIALVVAHVLSRLTSLASWLLLANGSRTRRAARFLTAALASARAMLWEATQGIQARLEAIEVDRSPAALPLAHLGLMVAAGIHSVGLAVLRLSGRTVSIVLVEAVLLSVSGLAAAGACRFVVGRERTLAALRRREDEELTEIAASFRSSDWRRRIGGS